jgi:threonine/homoserine/homoserine lactone efflux protein
MSSVIAMGMFSLLMSATPGPVNILTLNSGLKNGFKRTVPFVLGATIGFTLLLIVLGLGLAKLISYYPVFLYSLSYLATFYLFYLSYKLYIASSHIDLNHQKENGFIRGVSLQWMNPKAWIACFPGLSAFCTHSPYWELLTFSVIYFSICLLSISAWALMGNVIKAAIKKPAIIAQINKISSLCLFLCAFLIHL